MTEIHLINANSLNIPLKSQSIQCVITSPPYFGLRDYGHSEQIGLEETPAAYVEKLVCVFREVWRVLKDDGVLWLNLGDSYNAYKANTGDTPYAGFSNRPNHRKSGYGLEVKNLKNKDIIGIPWMVAFALRDDGWFLRQDIIWHKPNPMPESVTDRCTKSHEYVFLLTKKARYFYDHEAIKEQAVGNSPGNKSHKGKTAYENGDKKMATKAGLTKINAVEKRNRRSVWSVMTKPYKKAHFATFPPELVEPMILAGSKKGDYVLDPFAGTATVGVVSIKHRRKFLGLELNPAYIQLGKERTRNVQVSLL